VERSVNLAADIAAVATKTRVRTIDGCFDFVDPDPATITLADIVAGLRRGRWSDLHAYDPYPVLYHSIHTFDVACTLTDDMAERRTTLMHDAHEAYVGDVPSPLKVA
jgi:hypothetical protein